jgi:hypothetical protein
MKAVSVSIQYIYIYYTYCKLLHCLQKYGMKHVNNIHYSGSDIVAVKGLCGRVALCKRV